MQNTRLAILFVACSLALVVAIGCGQTTQRQLPLPPSSTDPGADPGALPSSVDAKETVERFRAVLKGGDFSTATWMLDNVDPTSPAGQSHRLNMKALSQRMMRGGYDFKVFEAKEMTDCAVAITRDNQTSGSVELKPMYLIRRDGRWLISPSLHKWAQMGSLDKAQYARFKELDYWYEIRKAEYKVILGEKQPRP